MTVTSGFFNSVSNDRVYDANQMSSLFDGILADGVFTIPATAFAVLYGGTGLNVTVQPGRAWFNHTWTLNDANLTLTPQTADPTFPRIDTVVLEVDTSDAVRANSFKIVKGTAAASPVRPTLIHTSTKNQYPLCDIAIAAAATTINQGNITSRIGTVDCPLASGVLPQITLTDLLGAYDTQFNAWLSNLQNQLDSNQASNLQNQIDSLTLTREGKWTEVSDVWTYASSTTINVPSNATLKYVKGTKVRFKQGGAYKYFNLGIVASTLLTIIPNNTYTITNAAITDIAYSFDSVALGFPETLPFTPGISFGGNSVGVTYSLQSGAYWIRGNQIFFTIAITLTNKGSSTGAALITNLPIAVGTHAVGIDIGNITNLASLTGAIMITLATNTLSLSQQSSTGMSALSDANITNTSIFRLSGSYLF